MEGNSKMDLSLDEIIKLNKKSRGGGARGGLGRGGGARGRLGRGGRGIPPARGGRGRGAISRPRPYSRPASLPDRWEHDLFEQATVTTRVAGGSKLDISNLDFGVSDNDMKELFSEFGALKRCTVHYDRSGRSLGTAEVYFTSSADAMKAQQTYNNVNLDGRPMHIQVVGGGASTSRSSIAARIDGGGPFRYRGGAGGQPRRMMDRSPVRGGGGSGGRRGVRGGRGGGRKKPRTEEELDAELAAYTSHPSMDTSA